MRVLPCGLRALIVEVETPDQRRDLTRRLEHAPPRGVEEVVPAARTVLLVLRPDADAADITREIQDLPEAPSDDADDARSVTVEVTYDGPDLDEVAEHLGISSEEVVRRHTGQTWTCEFGGFLPGFGYLGGVDGGLDVPRRDSPRERIPAGSVALAAGWSAVYPSSSPGGWQLIGRTAQRMFDVERDPPGLITAGTVVRFVEAAEQHETVADTAINTSTTRVEPGGADHADAASSGLAVEHVQSLALIQDHGRPGYRHLGVPPSGPADRASLTRGNRLLGNPDAAAGIETLLGGLVVRAQRPLLVAVTGGAANVTVDGVPASFGAPVSLRSGQRLEIGAATTGLRCYLCVRGGITESADAPSVLGSMSSDPTSNLGPLPLREGDVLAVGTPTGEPHVGLSIPAVSTPADGLEIRATWGPRADWLTAAGRDDFRSSDWTVSSRTDRVGIRLDGTPPPLERSDQLPSEGLVRGCVQVPPDGGPIMFLADHPTTGGYPVVAVVDDADTDLLAQAAPGTRVHLRVR